MNTLQSLKTRRQIASKASRGTSSGVIYATFEQTIKELELKGDVLDFGAGTGSLTCRLKSSNLFNSITAIDLFPRPSELEEVIKWISWDLNESTNFPDQSFDVIIAAEIIEHLENPRAVVREWFRLLRPQGRLLFSTPNNESWRALLALILQGHFVAFSDTCYPAHITALLQKDIERILQEVGFKKLEFRFTDSGGIPKLPGISWQSISGNFLKGVRFSDNVLVMAQKLSQ
ncbi:MAG: methyltransferase domain-containing protein [Trichocoleus desertorum ATA4-8-CV12]|nr:methyltransferase domain-containing protein [Trichocoleus desertorum ATA4-8-CV12]